MTYAIFATGGRQFRAEPGATIKVPLLAAEPGSKVTFDEVLLASDGKHVHAGKPVVKGARVTAEVVRHAKGKKIRIYRFARHPGSSSPRSRSRTSSSRADPHGSQEGRQGDGRGGATRQRQEDP